MKKDFQLFLKQLSETNTTLDYFVDFDKVINKMSKVEIKLNQLNYLLGHKNIKEGINELFIENKSVFDVLDILIAIRRKQKKKIINNNNDIVLISSLQDSPEKIFSFINETGLYEVFKNKNISNLVDYAFGVEVGLDTHARKNRGGKQMENAVSNILKENEFKFSEQIPSTNFPDLKNLGNDTKRFDFVIESKETTYLIEANFFNGSGSKLNETARAYSDISTKINQNKGFEFVWVTDGPGWLNAKNKVEEAYSNIPHVYNLKSLPLFLNQIN